MRNEAKITSSQLLALFVALAAIVWLAPLESWPLRLILLPFASLVFLYIVMTHSKNLHKHAAHLAYAGFLALALLIAWLAIISGVRPLAMAPWILGSAMVGTYAITGLISNQPLRDRSPVWKFIGVGPVVTGLIAGVLWVLFLLYALSTMQF